MDRGPQNFESYVDSHRRSENELEREKEHEQETNDDIPVNENEDDNEEVQEEEVIQEEVQSVHSSSSKEGEKSDLKDLLICLTSEMKDLKVQVGDIAKRQDQLDMNRQVAGATRRLANESNLDWRGQETVHECISMPNLMRVDHSSPAVQRECLRGSEECNVLPRQRPDRVPGLKPILDRDDISRYCPVPGIPEKILKGALSGEYFVIEHFLLNNIVEQDESSKPMELCAQADGKVMYKAKRRTRAVYSFGTWLEAWLNYSRTMINYHGISVSEKVLTYIKHIQEYDRKHAWKLVENLDVQNRINHGGRDIEFSKIDVMLLFSNFDKGEKGQQRYNFKCEHCKTNDHYATSCPLQTNTLNQPFQGNPGRQAGRSQRGSYQGATYNSSGYAGSYSNQRSGGRVLQDEPCDNWNDSRCYASSCRRLHICRSCGGNLPHSLCSRFGKCAGIPEQAAARD